MIREFNLDPEGAINWVEGYIKQDIDAFLAARDALPSWGDDVDDEVKKYVDGIGYWVRGMDCWSFESQRYFGKDGLAIQKHRVVRIQHKSTK